MRMLQDLSVQGSNPGLATNPQSLTTNSSYFSQTNTISSIKQSVVQTATII